MAKGRDKNSHLTLHFHIVKYLDTLTLSTCWLPFIGQGALFVPAQPVRPWLQQEIPAQVLLLQLPDLRKYCLSARVIMILPAGTGPGRRGGYLMLLDQPPESFLAAVESDCSHDHPNQRPTVKTGENRKFINLAEWLHYCADNDSTHALQ